MTFIKFCKFSVAISEENVTQCDNHDNVCITPGCVIAAAHILQRIDTSVDPCDDFYQFSCGTFMKNAIIPDEMADENMVNIINQKIQNQIRALIAVEPVPSDLNSFKLAKNFYKSCMDEKSIENRGIQPLIDLTKLYGGWPVIEGDKWNEDSWNWFDVLTKMLADGLDFSLLFEFGIAPSFINSTVNRIYVCTIYRTVHIIAFHEFSENVFFFRKLFYFPFSLTIPMI